MARLDIPFNIDLLIPDDRTVATVRPVLALEPFLGTSKNFHPDGLYSNESFGIVGTPPRSTRYAYIDIKVPIIHPTIYIALMKLCAFYKGIVSGKEFARFDPELGDFVKSDLVDGHTGYEYFASHITKLVLPSNDSIGRQQAIALYDKFKNKCLITKVLVLPAGLRDLEIDEYGRSSSDDVNELYYKLIAISNTINPSSVKASLESFNQQRVSLQNTFNEIYTYFSKIIEGKKNLLMGKWASRKVFNGTRNVMTSNVQTNSVFGHPSNPTVNSCLVGLYQTSKGMQPITIYQLKTGFLDRCFTTPGAPALLTDSTTLESKRVMLKAQTYGHWLSTEGLEKLLTYFKEETIRHDPIKVEGYYLGLCYTGPDGTFALINGVDQLPADRLASDCHPITYAELLYCALYSVANTYSGYFTRYPIAGPGSVYPCRVHLKSTVRMETRAELDPDSWELKGAPFIAYEFPRRDSKFYNSISVNATRLAGLVADHDGDVGGYNIVYTDEALKECNEFYRSRKAYMGTDGRFSLDTNYDTIRFVLNNITGRIKYQEIAS